MDSGESTVKIPLKTSPQATLRSRRIPGAKSIHDGGDGPGPRKSGSLGKGS
ncbi:hypothetical protein TREPR_3211 [Treponema primitia ZAS-2]|uniref:Uncharacterized protein n=1 Tax=Treponema primitia (strain ATCC BAA-887 / DSM 12427 / ZAS-2) TaxID=545694 RepID=F5YL02_TREPZ|nr:hypothetical protein TREPR_3211 [Treponema primitia ZAS-2]